MTSTITGGSKEETIVRRMEMTWAWIRKEEWKKKEIPSYLVISRIFDIALDISAQD